MTKFVNNRLILKRKKGKATCKICREAFKVSAIISHVKAHKKVFTKIGLFRDFFRAVHKTFPNFG